MTITQKQINTLKDECESAARQGHMTQECYVTLPADDVGMALEELEELRAQSGWNFNMGEAPKDGSSLLVFTDTEASPKDIKDCILSVTGCRLRTVQIAYWDDAANAALHQEDPCWRYGKVGDPIAWMPLPLPPQETAND